jgi:DNA helicase HerA-like ATPase
VYEAIKLSYQDCGWTIDGSIGRTPTIDDFVVALEKIEIAKKGKNARARLTPLTDFGLFDNPDSSIDLLARTTVIDMSKLQQEGVQKAATSFVLRKIYKEMMQNGPAERMQQMIILDEAHRSAKDATLPKLMKEGRKFGIGVVVASQQISDFHPNLLGNVGLKIAFRTNFPESRKVAGMFVDRSGLDISGLVESLGVGEALVSIPPKGNPLKLKMRQ